MSIGFVFTCPVGNRVFESDDFEIVENNGVTVDAGGRKRLDAKVALTRPCPFCGTRHVFHADELSCPFG